jgi:hypothetical protein
MVPGPFHLGFEIIMKFSYIILNHAQAQIRGNILIPSDGTTSSHNIKEDGNAIRTNGERPRYNTITLELDISRKI